MIALFMHEWRLSRRVLLVLALALGAFAFAMAMIAPSMQQTLSEALRFVPPILRPMVGERLQAKGLAGVVSLAYTHPIWLTLLGAWAVGYGSRAIAADLERGTLGLTLSYPLSRNQVLAAKALMLFAGIALLSGVTVLATFLGLSTQQQALPAGLAGYLWAAAGMALLFGCLGAFAFMCSAIASEGGRALGWALGFAVGSYFVDALGQFWKTAEPYRPWSIFRHYDPKVLLEGGPPGALAWAYLGGVTLACLIAAWIAFNRRDLSM